MVPAYGDILLESFHMGKVFRHLGGMISLDEGPEAVSESLVCVELHHFF